MDGAGRYDNLHGDEDFKDIIKDDVSYDIRIDWHYDDQQYVAYFAEHRQGTIGLGDTAQIAALDLIENANNMELQHND